MTFQLETCTQDGDHYHHFGPLPIDCTQKLDLWQYYDGRTIGLPLGMSIQSGHACPLDPTDKNLDNIHIKYGNSYVDIATETGKGGRCKTHNEGASCIINA